MASKPVAPRKRTTFETVLRIGCELPGVEAATSWGAAALKVRGKMFACRAIHRSAEPDTLVVRMDFDQRDVLVAADPNTYYLTDHYVDYACVLVRLARVHPDAMRDLLLTGWRFVSKSDRRVTRRRAASARPRRASGGHRR